LVTYTNLNPGDYRFHVQASNADGIWHEASRTSLALTVTPPWWKTLWFRLSGGMLLVALATSGHFLQRRNDTLQQRKLERLVDERTHELQDARTQISTLLDSSPLGICLADPEGKILAVNRSMLDIFGYDEEELLQTNVRALYKEPEQHIQILAQVADAGVLSDYGILLQRRNGSPFYGNLNLNRLKVDGEALMLSVVDDITEEVESRQALTVLHQISYDLASIVELEPLVDHALRQLRKIVDYRHAVLLLAEQGNESSTLQAYVASAPPSEFNVTQISMNDWPFLRSVLDEPEVIYVPDMHAGEIFQTGVVGLKIEQWADALKTSRSLLGLPMVAGERFVGMLNILHDSLDAYDASEMEVAHTFANQLAVAIDNVRLNKQAQQAAADHERSRIARDLHDSVTQTLFTASMIAEATPRIWDRDSDLARQNLGRISLLTRGALAEMRSLLVELRSGVLADQTLEQLIETLAEATRVRSNAAVVVCIDCYGDPPPETVMAFYRITQETLNNTAKHAEATRIEISLTCEPDCATLEISDDGRGFDPQTVADGHLGLRIMAERAAEIGGDLEVKSSPGQGTQIRLRWPRSNDGENHG
jgi:two-component system nitrate/nitrite sensor histidine kinase NarX